MWLLVALLALLLGVLAALQYHWTGEIGRGEGDRQRARLDRAGQRFAGELGRELTRAAMTFGPVMHRGEDGRWRAALQRRLELWRSTDRAELISRLVLLTRTGEGTLRAEVAETGRTPLVEVPFPSHLDAVRPVLEARSSGRRFPPPAMAGPPPAILTPVITSGRDASPQPGAPAGTLEGILVIELDDAYLSGVLLPELAEGHFGPLGEGDYVVAVERRHDGSLLYSSDPDLAPDELAQPDLRVDLPGLFGRPDSPGGRFEGAFGPGRGPDPGGRRPGPPPGPPGHERPPRLSGGDRRVAPELPEAEAPWVLLVRHRGGSLAEAVDAVRQRNLAVGLGVLALLGAAAVTLAVNGHRARQLARQQLEFVAGVTHELHTPLTALRSAGQNLADGVVSEPEQVRRYGQLIRKEGARLTVLVGQVLDFAGIESGARAYDAAPLAVEPLVRRALADMRLVLEDAGIAVDVEVPGALPNIRGDESALRRALENLLANAVKFAGRGGWVGVGAKVGPDRGWLTLRVEDRGPGIPRSERDQVFEPFYRGTEARRGQLPGSGLGLSLVRHVAEGHGGRVHVDEREGGGAVVSLQLPTTDAPAEEYP